MTVVIRVKSKYKELRLEEYPSIGDQLDMLWHSMDEDPSKRVEPFYTSLLEVKNRYPKPEEESICGTKQA